MDNKKINLIFTRDFDQWVQELCRNVLVVDVQKIWGKGLSDQIVHFDGVTSYWYRYPQDMDNIKNILINKSLNNKIFSKEKQDVFLKNVKDLKKEINLPISRIKNHKKHLNKITSLFKKIYPYYPLGIFIAGPWRDDFLKIHGKNGQKVLKILIHSREQSEGLLKMVGLHLRAWIGPRIQEFGYLPEYIRLMTVKEIKNFIDNKKLPSIKILKKRALGYVYIKNKIVGIGNFNKFLSACHLSVGNAVPTDDSNVLSGTVACRGKIVRGQIKKIFNSFEVSNFKVGEILVTPMTSPEYLPIMKKAKAIITDEGGLTCHAAITSRELGLPCIIGTKNATKIFKDGDIVEVDANKGIVRKINI